MPPITTPFSIDLSITESFSPMMMFDSECGDAAIVPKMAGVAA